MSQLTGDVAGSLLAQAVERALVGADEDAVRTDSDRTRHGSVEIQLLDLLAALQVEDVELAVVREAPDVHAVADDGRRTVHLPCRLEAPLLLTRGGVEGVD